MSEVYLLKDFLTPLFAAILGTAAGALTVSLMNESKIEFDKKSNDIKSTNSLLAECNLRISEIFNYLEDLTDQKNIFDREKIIAANYFETLTTKKPFPDFRKFFIGKLSIEEIKILCRESDAGLPAIYYSSKLITTFRNIQEYENSLHTEMDRLFSLMRSIEERDRIIGLKNLFGIEHNGQTHDFIDPTYENLITLSGLCILLIEEIINSVTSEKTRMKSEYESYEFKKLPNLVSIDLSSMKTNYFYPKKKDYSSYFESIK